MDTEPLFTGNDLRLIESLVFRPELKPGYDFIKGCLVWEDERADGLTPEGYDNLCDLWIARSFIHRGLDFSTYPLNPEYFGKVWERALQQGFSWPGYKRLTLNAEDKAYYEAALQDKDDI